MKWLYNKTDKDIADYPISEATLDANGNPIADNNAPDGYLWTGKTLAWSLAAGEKRKFPDYVAKILKERYEFLDVYEAEVGAEVKPEEMAKVVDGKITCKHCGANFKSNRGYALHMAWKHEKELLRA